MRTDQLVQSISNSHTWLLLALVFLAWLLVPVLVCAYRLIIVRRRLDDLRTNLWDVEAIASYVTLFTSESVSKGTERTRLDSIVQREFLSIHAGRQYFLATTLLCAVLAVTLGTCGAWAWASLEGLQLPITHLRVTFILAFAGAYVWSVFEMLSRMRSKDFTPDDLMEMSLRQIAALPIGYAFSVFGFADVEGGFAFAAAAFPLRELRLFMRQRMFRKLNEGTKLPITTGDEARLQQLVDGLGETTVSRLHELSIFTHLDLAYSDPIRLMAKSGYSLRQVLAWMDHALLAVYAPTWKVKLLDLGLPCALDVYSIHENCRAQGAAAAEADALIKAIAAHVKAPAICVAETFKNVHDDPHVQLLHSLWYSDATAS